MRFIYILIIMVIILGFAIGFTLKGERFNPYNRYKGKVDLQCEYIDSNIRMLPPILEINYFEEQNDVYNLFVISKKSKVQRTQNQRTQGKYSVEIVFGTTWEEIALVYFPEQWNKYRYLKLDIYNPQDTFFHLQFRVGDYFDDEKFYLDSQRFKKEMELNKGWNKLEFNMSEIAKKIDINSPHKSIHLSFFRDPKGKVYIDNIRLVK